MRSEAGYYRHPTLHGDRIVFVCEDDLWTVSADGGVARRLTANPGRCLFPVLSPDGTKIAFTGQDEGPSEVYVMDAEGGAPERLTHLGALMQTAAWRPDGTSIVFGTAWRQMFPGMMHLAEVSPAGGAPRELNLGPARAVSFQPDGKGIVIGRNGGDPARWKRYRGGTAGTLWADREGKGEFRPLVKLDGNLASPMWIGSRIYFLSDHEGHGNLYSVTPTGRSLTRHTDHEDYYVRFPSSDGERIVYHAGADLFVFDPTTNETRKVDVTIRSPRVGRSRKFVESASSLESFALHPKGHSVAVTARGGAHTFGLWDGPVVRHGAVSTERRRLAAYLSDGKRIVSISDRKGEEALVVENADGTGAAREVVGGLGRVLELEPAPAGAARVVVTNHRQELFLIDVAKRTKKRIAKSEYERIGTPAWSADGRYLTYAVSMTQRSASIRILDTTTGRSHAVTGTDFQDGMPAFDPSGRYLYFISWRVFDPVYDSHTFDLGFPRGARPYLVTLKKDDPSPFDASRRDPRLPTGVSSEDEAKGKKDDKAKKPALKIDFAGIEDRVVPVPVPEGRYLRVLGTPDRILMSSLPIQGSLEEGDESAPHATLQAWELEAEKIETISGGMTDFATTPDGKVLAIQVGKTLRVVNAAAKAAELDAKDATGRAAGWIDLERVQAEVQPGAEWKQMLREAWRLQRDQFWTPDMSGIDWKGVLARYLPLVDRIGTRTEFSDLAWEMQGELGTSHCYEMGGDYKPLPLVGYHQGFLGANLEYRARTKSWHVAKILRGDGWKEGAGSPLAAPGLSVKVGDRIVAVDGTKVGADTSPYAALVNRARRAVRLTLQTGKAKPRQVVVDATPAENGLRYRDWVEANRARVHKDTKGKVGYVHVPDMGAHGFAEFHRYFRTEVDRDGLIIDVRFNGGGHVSQLILEKLLRKRVGYDEARWQKGPISYPDMAPMGPMVALTNEYAGSDGDIFSQAWKIYGLGPLIGKRTWGGVVGIWPRHALVDGTVTSQPEFSFWFEGVGWGVENYGVDPDIEVEITPQDHHAGRDTQLERGLKEIGTILRKAKPGVPTFDDRPNLNPPRLP